MGFNVWDWRQSQYRQRCWQCLLACLLPIGFALIAALLAAVLLWGYPRWRQGQLQQLGDQYQLASKKWQQLQSQIAKQQQLWQQAKLSHEQWLHVGSWWHALAGITMPGLRLTAWQWRPGHSKLHLQYEHSGQLNRFVSSVRKLSSVCAVAITNSTARGNKQQAVLAIEVPEMGECIGG